MERIAVEKRNCRIKEGKRVKVNKRTCRVEDMGRIVVGKRQEDLICIKILMEGKDIK